MEGRRLGDVAKELRACHSGGGLSQAAKAREPSMHVFLIDAWAQRSILGGRRKLEVKPWATVREVKNGIAKLLRIPPQRQQLRAPASADARAGTSTPAVVDAARIQRPRARPRPFLGTSARRSSRTTARSRPRACTTAARRSSSTRGPN
jgi:hypothetical protein